jgi:predicted HicB family RNase H-like nuclease
VIPRSVYPQKAWPLASMRQHPCLSFLAAEANDFDTKPNRLREVRAVLAVMDHVGRNPAAYAEPQPLARAFDTIRDMPPSYDKGALITELERLKLFVVEHHALDAVLVPAESAGAEPEAAPAAPKTAAVASRVPMGVAERLSADAKRRGVSLSALIASVLSDYAATA